jgi:hypothetical protein
LVSGIQDSVIPPGAIVNFICGTMYILGRYLQIWKNAIYFITINYKSCVLYIYIYCQFLYDSCKEKSMEVFKILFYLHNSHSSVTKRRECKRVVLIFMNSQWFVFTINISTKMLWFSTARSQEIYFKDLCKNESS